MKKGQLESASFILIAVVTALMLIFATFTIIGKDPSDIKRSSMDEVLVSYTLNTLLRTDVPCNLYCHGLINIKDLLVLSRSIDDFDYVKGIMYMYLQETYEDKGFDYSLTVFDDDNTYIELGDGCLLFKSDTYVIPAGNKTIQVRLDLCH